jgi:NitT/TauT family transport system permease protein
MELKFFYRKKVNIELIDIFIILFIFSFIYGLISFGKGLNSGHSYVPNISLSPKFLPLYAWLSILRQLAAFILSLIFSIGYGYLASHYKRAEVIMLPLLDVMQSIPLLSFLPIFVLALVNLFPSVRIGIEISSILLIFTSQVWNMAFSVYGSMKAIPRDLNEVSNIFNFNNFFKFINLELPVSIIGLVWNSMMSIAGGWFFLMASEMFILGGKDFRLPGLGSYLQLAAMQGNITAIICGLLTIVLIVVITDQLIWRPLIAWSQRFKTELKEEEPPRSLLLIQLRRSRIMNFFTIFWNKISENILHSFKTKPRTIIVEKKKSSLLSTIVYALLALVIFYGAFRFFTFTIVLKASNWYNIIISDLLTLLRVFIALALSLAWTLPVGVAIGLNKKLANRLEPVVQIFASIPATAIFPIIVMWMISFRGGINIASILLMLLGTQWYILFNVIAGAQSIPTDLKEVSQIFSLKGIEKWKTLILPSIMPFLITGLITAAGGAWNASIVSEYIQFRGSIHKTTGIGSLISSATNTGNYALIAAGTFVMVVTVVLINRFIWRKLYWKAIEHR